MPPTATKAPPRKEIDDEVLASELDAERGEDDGLGEDLGGGDPPQGEKPTEVSQEEFDDPNSEFNTNIPGGRKPGDDGYVEPTASPPTPPADLNGSGEGDGGQEVDNGETDDEEVDGLALAADRELGLRVGGKKPENCILKFKGATVNLGKGQFDLEDRFRTVDVWQVTGDLNQHSIETRSGEVKSASKTQSATLCGTTRLEDWLASSLREFEEEEDVRRIMGGLGLETPPIEE